MSRGLFFFERFLLVGGRRPWNVILVARLRGVIDPRVLADALAGLQAHHPMLCVGIVQRGRQPHFEQPQPLPPIPLRIVERAGDDDWFEAVGAELERPFDVGRGPLARAVWIGSPAVSELVLVADHCICDGRSMLLLMRELVEGLGAARRARATQPAIGTIHDLFPGSASGTDRVGLLRHMASLGWVMRTTAPLVQWLRRARAVGPSYVLRWELDAPTSAALSTRCRAEQATAYAALATAFLRAVRAVRPRQSRNRLLCPVDIRTQVPGIGPDTLFAFPETIGLSVETRLDCAFWSQARALRRDLLARRERLDPRRTLLLGERLHGLSDWFVTLQLHGRARNDLMFSHVGEASVASGGGGPTVEAVLGFLSSMPWRGTTAIFSLRDAGVMRFFLVAREETLPRAEAGRIRDDAMARIAAEVASLVAPAPAIRRAASRRRPAR